jgi:hypothetical protein
MRQLRIVAALLVTVLALFVAACGDDDDSDSGSSGSSGETAKAKPGTLDLWVGGNFAGATPGTPYREWLDSQISRSSASEASSSARTTARVRDAADSGSRFDSRSRRLRASATSRC